MCQNKYVFDIFICQTHICFVMHQIHGLYFKTSRPGSRAIDHEWQDLTKGEFLEKKRSWVRDEKTENSGKRVRRARGPCHLTMRWTTLRKLLKWHNTQMNGTATRSPYMAGFSCDFKPVNPIRIFIFFFVLYCQQNGTPKEWQTKEIFKRPRPLQNTWLSYYSY